MYNVESDCGACGGGGGGHPPTPHPKNLAHSGLNPGPGDGSRDVDQQDPAIRLQRLLRPAGQRRPGQLRDLAAVLALCRKRKQRRCSGQHRQAGNKSRQLAGGRCALGDGVAVLDSGRRWVGAVHARRGCSCTWLVKFARGSSGSGRWCAASFDLRGTMGGAAGPGPAGTATTPKILRSRLRPSRRHPSPPSMRPAPSCAAAPPAGLTIGRCCSIYWRLLLSSPRSVSLFLDSPFS